MWGSAAHQVSPFWVSSPSQRPARPFIDNEHSIKTKLTIVVMFFHVAGEKSCLLRRKHWKHVWLVEGQHCLGQPFCLLRTGHPLTLLDSPE